MTDYTPEAYDARPPVASGPAPVEQIPEVDLRGDGDPYAEAAGDAQAAYDAGLPDIYAAPDYTIVSDPADATAGADTAAPEASGGNRPGSELDLRSRSRLNGADARPGEGAGADATQSNGHAGSTAGQELDVRQPGGTVAPREPAGSERASTNEAGGDTAETQPSSDLVYPFTGKVVLHGAGADSANGGAEKDSGDASGTDTTGHANGGIPDDDRLPEVFRPREVAERQPAEPDSSDTADGQPDDDSQPAAGQEVDLYGARLPAERTVDEEQTEPESGKADDSAAAAQQGGIPERREDAPTDEEPGGGDVPARAEKATDGAQPSDAQPAAADQAPAVPPAPEAAADTDQPAAADADPGAGAGTDTPAPATDGPGAAEYAYEPPDPIPAGSFGSGTGEASAGRGEPEPQKIHTLDEPPESLDEPYVSKTIPDPDAEGWKQFIRGDGTAAGESRGGTPADANQQPPADAQYTYPPPPPTPAQAAQERRDERDAARLKSDPEMRRERRRELWATIGLGIAGAPAKAARAVAEAAIGNTPVGRALLSSVTNVRSAGFGRFHVTLNVGGHTVTRTVAGGIAPVAVMRAKMQLFREASAANSKQGQQKQR